MCRKHSSDMYAIRWVVNICGHSCTTRSFVDYKVLCWSLLWRMSRGIWSIIWFNATPTVETTEASGVQPFAKISNTTNMIVPICCWYFPSLQTQDHNKPTSFLLDIFYDDLNDRILKYDLRVLEYLLLFVIQNQNLPLYWSTWLHHSVALRPTIIVYCDGNLPTRQSMDLRVVC